MTRFVVDAEVLLRIASGLEVAPEHEVLAPTLVRSQALSILHEAVHAGKLPSEEALERLEMIGRMKVRLLGDAVLRRVAWKVADEMGWASTYDAEYIALTQLQADAFITLDKDLAKRAREIVEVAPVSALTA